MLKYTAEYYLSIKKLNSYFDLYSHIRGKQRSELEPDDTVETDPIAHLFSDIGDPSPFIPEDAHPRLTMRGCEKTINFYSKYLNGKGLNNHEACEFGGICEYGPQQLITCLGMVFKVDEALTPTYTALHCETCPHCIATRFDEPVTNLHRARSMWDANSILTSFKDYVEGSHPNAFVYFVSDGEYVKIGKANNVAKRLATLQTANARHLQCLYLIPAVDDSAAVIMEGKLHKLYKDYRLEGEWFDVLGKLDKSSFLSLFPADKYLGCVKQGGYEEC